VRDGRSRTSRVHGQAGRRHGRRGDVQRDPLSQKVKLGLGAQAGERRLGHVFAEGGFSRLRRATETPFNLVLEARK
jgi:hypothetical protein